MKRLRYLGGVLAFSLALITNGRAHAQSVGTKVAVVNVGDVFLKYEKAKTYKADLEKRIAPRKAEAETMKKQIIEWQNALKHPKVDPKNIEAYQQAIISHSRKLEDLSRLVATEIGKIQETQVVELFKDLNMAVDATAKAQGFQLVLAYGNIPGDPLTVDNIQRKIGGMDLGSTNPFFLAGSVDLSEQVVASLNNYYRSTAGGAAGGAVVPAAGVRPGM